MKEISDNTRMVLFVALTILVFGIFSHFYKPPVPPPQDSNQTTGQKAPTQANVMAPAMPQTVPVIQASDEKNILVESPLYSVELSNRGGVVRSWKLKKYLDDQTPAHPLDLVNAAAAQQLGWPFSLKLSDAQLESQANSALFQVTSSTGSTDGALSAPVDITFHWSDGHIDVTKKLGFTADYQLTVDTSVSIDGKPAAPVGISWLGGFGDRAIANSSQLVSVYYQQNGSLNLLTYKKLGVSGNQIQAIEQPGPMEYLGIEDQFFTAAFIPNGTDLTLWDWTQYHALTDGTEPEPEIAAGTKTAGPLKMRVYVGPKDLAILTKLQPSLEKLINFGWFGVIAKPLLFALQWLHRYISNWGWTIVVFTLGLAMVLLPIRIWTFHSMRKMQVVAPEMKAIQDRYKKYSMSDPRKRNMNEEMMNVYKEHGLSPFAQLGGCVPMLLQMPFLFAFYRVLSGTIELRHAPWILWIHDLAARDPYYVLPVAMAVTTYLMTKMTPTPSTVDPAQQKMMALMPLMFLFFFFRLSAGLNLYYFVSNLVGVGQQVYLNKTQPLPSRSKFKRNKT